MSNFARLVAAVVILLCAHESAHAQREVAPAPHPALDELVKEYKRWGLPLPPPEAQLVRLQWNSRKGKPCGLYFFQPPIKRGEQPRYFSGDGWWSDEDFVAGSTRTVLTKPVLADLEGVVGWDWGWFYWAAQFKLRGWDDIAAAAYSEAVTRWIAYQPRLGEPKPTVFDELRAHAWAYWEHQLEEKVSDRKAAWIHLSALERAKAVTLTKKDEYTLKDLEATIAPRKSKPGSAEELIDGLTDFNSYWVEDEAGNAAYWRLMELGFDAVPALIEHLEDWRLTRFKTGGVNNLQPRLLRVADVITGLLNDLSGEEFSRNNLIWSNGGTLHSGDALKWWGRTRQLNEEKWLVAHALTREEESRAPEVNQVAVRALQIKYPRRLQDVYQAVLKQRQANSELVTAAIVASKLSREQKVALLEDGAKREDYWHRSTALKALAAVNVLAFRKHILAGLESLPDGIELVFNYNERDLRSIPIDLLYNTDDAKCWAALKAATLRVPTKTQLYIVRMTGWPAAPGQPDLARRERLRFLLWSLGDEAVEGLTADDARDVRGSAALQLAKHFGLFDRLLDPQTDKLLQHPRELSLLRDRTRDLAERELARPVK